MDRDLNDLAAFAHVVEQGGFTAGAKAAQLPKSSISRRVANLEQRLGVRLLERTTRKVHVTEIGDVYYRHCRRMLDEANHADLCVEHAVETPRGTLRISATVTTGQYLVAPILAEFMGIHPEVRVDLVLANRHVDVVDEGFDLVVRAGPLADSSLVARSLGHCGLFIYGSPDYLALEGIPNSPEDLKSHQCLVMSDMHPNSRWKLVSDDAEKQIGLVPRVVANDFVVLRNIVADGAGLAVLPGYLHDAQHQKRIVRVLENWSLRPIEFHAVFPSHRGATPKVRAFLDFIAAKLAPALNGVP